MHYQTYPAKTLERVTSIKGNSTRRILLEQIVAKGTDGSSTRTTLVATKVLLAGYFVR